MLINHKVSSIRFDNIKYRKVYDLTIISNHHVITDEDTLLIQDENVNRIVGARIINVKDIPTENGDLKYLLRIKIY